jgi:hypothetical protein
MSEKRDPNQHKSKKAGSGPAYLSENQDPDPHQLDADPHHGRGG